MPHSTRYRQSGAHDAAQGSASADEMLLKVVDGSLAGCIFLVPFLMGGRQALGQLVLVLLAAVAAILASGRPALR